MNRDDIPLPITFMDSDDAELEHRVRECGENMLREYEAGNREAAEQWLEAQRVAINSRSGCHVARLEQERGLV